jgi:hypothetical protein
LTYSFGLHSFTNAVGYRLRNHRNDPANLALLNRGFSHFVTASATDVNHDSLQASSALLDRLPFIIFHHRSRQRNGKLLRADAKRESNGCGKRSSVACPSQGDGESSIFPKASETNSD